MENTRVLIVRLLTSVLYLTLALLMFSSCKKDKSSNEIAIAEVAAGVKFYMKQPNTVTTAPNIRTYFNLTLTYQGPRY